MVREAIEAAKRLFGPLVAPLARIRRAFARTRPIEPHAMMTDPAQTLTAPTSGTPGAGHRRRSGAPRRWTALGSLLAALAVCAVPGTAGAQAASGTAPTVVPSTVKAVRV